MNPIDGYMFWSHWLAGNKKACIFRAWLDGSHRELLIESTNERPMKWPLSLVADVQHKKLYWCVTNTSLGFRNFRIFFYFICQVRCQGEYH